MQQYHKILKQQEKKLAPKLLSKNKLICKQMKFGDSEPLYIAKSHWTNRFDPDRDKTIGIFYAIWVSPKLIKQEKFAYNIHAKQIAKLEGYKLIPRKFADQFRDVVESRVSGWPGIRLDHGPSTLLQGEDACHLDNFADAIEKRVADFVSIYQEIDKLLDASST